MRQEKVITNKEAVWRVLCIPVIIFIVMDSQNMGPTDLTLVLHELGHWIFGLIFTFKVPEMTFDFDNGSGLCHIGHTFFLFRWIIFIMGAGFQNIVGAVIFRLSKPKNIGHIFRSVGLTLYCVGWFDLNPRKATFYDHIPADFAEHTVPKLILFLILNYFLIWRVMAGIRNPGSSLYREFMIQGGYSKRSDMVLPSPVKKVRKRRIVNFRDEFLYQSGIKKRPF